MVNKEHLSFRFLLVAFFLILAAMIIAGLYPFNFFPPNRVQWLSNEPGLYFNGAGIAYTHRAEPFSLKKAVSVELLLKERRGSKNWGPKEIFSFYDGPVSPSLLVGQWDGRIFIYSRFEKNEGHKWYKLFRTKQRFPRGKSHLVTVTFDESEKAIYIDGQLRNRKNVEIVEKTHIEFFGSLLLGNSPMGKAGWNGEIKGLAVYSRILLPDEILTHSREIFKKGVSALAETPGCLAVYLFDEGKGNFAKSSLSKPRPFSIPARLNALALTMFSLPYPYKDMRFYSFGKSDFFKNIVFFVLFGSLLSAIIRKKYATGYLATFLIITLTGGLLSCVIEGLQLFLPTRATQMADVLGNTLGTGLGMLIASIMMREKS
jgi:VanZ family protein